MIYNATDGTVLSVTQTFLDDNELPLLARPGYPQVRLVDADKMMLSSVIASPTTNPGEWTAQVSIPNLGLTEKTELRLVWRFMTATGEKLKVTDPVITEPKVDQRVTDIVSVFGDARFGLVLPQFFAAPDSGTYDIYANNASVFLPQGSTLDTRQDLLDSKITRTTSIDRTNFQIPLIVPRASLGAYLVKLDIVQGNTGQSKTYTYKLWAATPQILLGMSYLEDFLNKSKIEQVIPELQYQDGDLILYLTRGLNLLNMVGQPSAFSGTNMQGVLFDAWVTCACYYALGSQLLAEGSLAFDFSGQGVSLNVDRTPQLDAALGRIESQINDRILPLKKYLAKQGIMGGDGSAGKGTLSNPSNVGTLGLINAATTRVRGLSNPFAGRRW